MIETEHRDTSVLLFDFGGTLDADGVPWKARFYRLWREELGEIEPERFDRAFYDADDALVGALAPRTPLAETLKRLARGIARRLCVEDTASVDRIAARFGSEASANLSRSARLLKRLATRYRLGVVSNFYGNLAAICEETGLAPHLSVAIDSACLGFAKPDPRIFESALAALDTRAADALFVGDSVERDMTGARGIGMRHVLLSDPRLPALASCCPEDRVIRRLEDLTEVLS